MNILAKSNLEQLKKLNLPEKAKATLVSIEKLLESEKSESNAKGEAALNKFYNQVKEVAAKKREEKTQKEVNEKTIQVKASDVAAPAEKKEIVKVANEIDDAIDTALKNDPELAGFGKSDKRRDAGRKALPKGRRVSIKGWKNQFGKSDGGRVYYEGRENRTDRKSPSFKSGYPYLADGGKIHPMDEEDGTFYVNLYKTKNGAIVSVNEKEYSSKASAMTYAMMKRDFLKMGDSIFVMNDDGDVLYTSVGTNKMADGGEIKWQDVGMGDKALVLLENKMGYVVKPYGRRFHLKFPDGTEKTYSSEELEFYPDDNMMADGGMMAKGGQIDEKEKLSNISYQLINTEDSFKKNNPEAYSRMKDKYKAQFIKVYGKDEYAKRHMMADGGMTNAMNLINSKFADNYKKFGEDNSQLVNFDITNLDNFELMQYNQYSKSMDKPSALQILINNVEGDYSQLDEGLAEIAEEQYPSEEFFEENYAKGGMMADGGEVELGDTVYGNYEAINKVYNYKGIDWQISTHINFVTDELITRMYGGKFVNKNGYPSFEYDGVRDPNIILMRTKPAKITKEVTIKQHEKALEEFQSQADKWYDDYGFGWPYDYAKGGMMADGGMMAYVGKFNTTLIGKTPDLDEGYWENYKNVQHEELYPREGRYEGYRWVGNEEGFWEKYAKGGMMADGGAIIENQYEGRTAEDIWNNLTERQRTHFLVDHRRSIIGNDPKEPYYENSNKNWNDLDYEVSNGFHHHVINGQYAKGGMMARGGYMAEGENYEYVNTFKRFDSNVPVPQDDFEKLVNAYHKQLSGDKLAVSKYKVLKLQMGNYLGHKTVEEMEAYIEKTHNAHKMSMGGYMSDGGELKKGDKIVVLGKEFEFVRNEMDSSQGYDEERVILKNEDGIRSYPKDMIEAYSEYKMAKGGVLKNATYVSKRNINDIKVEINKSIKDLKGADLLDGVYVKNNALKAKFDATKSYNELSELNGKIWDKLKIESGSQIYASDSLQKKMAIEYQNMGLDAKFKKLTSAQRKKVAEIMTDENEHSLRNYLTLRGYLGQKEYDSYARLYEPKRPYVLNPANYKKEMASGGSIGFEGLSKKVAARYEGKNVKAKFQKQYGKTYDKTEAKEVGDKVAGKVYFLQQRKMAEGGKLNKGVKTEMKEHGMSKTGATKIAKDHIDEDKFYYSKLESVGLAEAGSTGKIKLPYTLKKYFTHPQGTVEIELSKLIPVRARKEGIANAEKYMRLAYDGKMERRKPITIYLSRNGKYRVYDGNSTFAIAKKNGWETIYATKIKNPNIANRQVKSVFLKAKEIRKPNEEWSDAVSRAKVMI